MRPLAHGWPLAVVFVLLVAPVARGADTVKVGSKDFTEGIILGEIITQLLQRSGIDAEHGTPVRGTTVLFKGLQAGERDAYVEYTGTLTEEILAGRHVRGEYGARLQLERMGLVLGPRLGFVNNYALGIRQDTAERLGINTIGDLKKHEQLRLGFSDEFMGRRDGWPAVKAKYDLPQQPRGLTHELALSGIDGGKLDVTDLYTTDAEIKQYRLRALVDDKGAMPSYHAVVLWRADLQTRSPKAVEVMARLENAIDTETMMAMNARVRIDRVPESVVAAEFLRDHLKVEGDVPEQKSRLSELARIVGVSTVEHLILVAISLTFAVVVAVPLGVLAYKVPQLGQSILALVGVVQTIPSLALLVFMIPFLGLGATPVLVALLLYSLLPIVRNTYQGLVEIPLSLRESAEVIGLPPRARLWRIELPLASRSILSGIKTAAVINVGTATIGAIIGAGGYGQPILTGIRLNDLPLILSGAVPAALMAVLVQQLFGWLERFVVPRGLRVA
jgi:osmoprotectant transport system permease protein